MNSKVHLSECLTSEEYLRIVLLARVLASFFGTCLDTRVPGVCVCVNCVCVCVCVCACVCASVRDVYTLFMVFILK